MPQKKNVTDMSELLRTDMDFFWFWNFVSVFFSRPSHENYLSRHPEISNLRLPKTSRSRQLHILPGLGQPKSSLKELGIFFQNNAESREIPTKIEMQKMGKIILRLPLRSKFKEKSTKTTGNWLDPAFFRQIDSNVWRTNSIKASFAPTSLQSCKFMHNCLLAPDAPSGNRAEDMWSFQLLDTEAGQRAHPEGYSSSFGSSRFHE